MNERLMRFGAVLYDGMWIFVLAMLVGGGIGWAVQSLQPVWLAWVLGMTLSAGMAVVVGRLMNWWHDRCVARRWRTILAMRVPLTAAFWQKTREGER